MRAQNRSTVLARRMALAVMLALCFAAQTLPAVAAPPAVELTIDFGDGAQLRFKALDYRPGMTVLDALAVAQKHPRGVKYAHRGRGASAIVTELGGLKNEGRGRNWLYAVNGKSADESAGSYQLKPGDAILWEFKAND
jgi:hypothetical protein